MKRIININLSKDTPAETVTALYAAIKAGKEPKRKQAPLYILNEDIEKLHARYEELFKQVKSSQNLSENQIEKECDVLSRKYDFEIEQLSDLRRLEYKNQIAEIKAREDEQEAVIHSLFWKLFHWFTPRRNRAQRIIDERAELEADKLHTDEEKQLKVDREKLYPIVQKVSKRELKRKLKATIQAVDKADLNEAFAEPQPAADVPTEQESATIAAPMSDGKPETVQEQEQAQIKPLPRTSARRPRPPRSCR